MRGLPEVFLGRLVSRGELGPVAVRLSAAWRAHVQGQGNIGAPPEVMNKNITSSTQRLIFFVFFFIPQLAQTSPEDPQV